MYTTSEQIRKKRPSGASSRRKLGRRHRRKPITKDQVLKLLRVAMEKQSSAATTEGTSAMVAAISENSQGLENDFFTTGRVGRRNAMPDILGEHCTTTTADLPLSFSALSTQEPTASTSAQPDGGGGTTSSAAAQQSSATTTAGTSGGSSTAPSQS